MKPKEAKVRVKIQLSIGFWTALKLRLAGGKVFEQFLRQQFSKTMSTTFEKRKV